MMLQDDQSAQETEDRVIEDAKIDFFDPWQKAFQEDAKRLEQEFEF